MMKKIVITESQLKKILKEEEEIQNIETINQELAAVGEEPIAKEDVDYALACPIQMPGEFDADHQSFIKKIADAIKTIKSPSDIRSAIKQIKSIKKNTNEQVETVTILGIATPIIMLQVIGGFIILLLVIKLIKLIFSGGERVSPECRRASRRMRGWSWGKPLEEQMLNNLLNKAREAVRSGVNNVAQKVATATQKQEPAPQPQEPKEDPKKHYDELVNMSKNRTPETAKYGYGFANGTGQPSSVDRAAKMAAIKDLTTPYMQTTTNPDGSTVSVANLEIKYDIVDSASYTLQQNGTITYYYAYVLKAKQ